jgi:RHS repeat-associated protein
MLCPLAAATGCIHYARLVYTRVTLMCSAAYPDGTLDQETFYGYDTTGRLVEEHIRDDSGRVAVQRYAWDKNGNLVQQTLPSAAVLGTTYDPGAGNSDAALPSALWRTSPATPIIDDIRWNPGGVLAQYHRQDRIGGAPLRMRMEYNLAGRPTLVILEGQTGGGPYYYLRLAEDAKGRVVKRDYYPSDPQIPGIFDSFLQYDHQDRLTCETTSHATSCPTAGATLKNGMPSGYTGAGDRRTLLRPVPGTAGGLTHVFQLAPGTHRIASVDQSDGDPLLGPTIYAYDARGNRTADDNTSFDTHLDPRTYGYDARDNLVRVSGQTYDPTTGETSLYTVRSAFDARNRRVFKSHVAFGKEAHWFFYYDPLDRLTEVRHTPDIAAPASTTTYQLVWLDDLLVAYWQTDQPSGATSKRYVAFDETGRPVRMHSWLPGNAVVSWAINPDAWGNDRVVIGPEVFQPIVFAGQYRDVETAAYLDDGVTVHRPALVLNGRRTYDPFTGAYLQLDPLVRDTWSPYAYADNDPAGKDDPSGLATAECKAWSCPAQPGDGDVIQVACTCTEWESGGPTGEWAGGYTGNGGGGRRLGGGGGGARGGARLPRTPRQSSRLSYFPVARPQGLQLEDEGWFQQCRADLMTGLDTQVEAMGMLVELPWSPAGSRRPIALGPPADFVPFTGGQWRGLEYPLAGDGTVRDVKFFCDVLRAAVDTYGPGGRFTR